MITMMYLIVKTPINANNDARICHPFVFPNFFVCRMMMGKMEPKRSSTPQKRNANFPMSKSMATSCASARPTYKTYISLRKKMSIRIRMTKVFRRVRITSSFGEYLARTFVISIINANPAIQPDTRNKGAIIALCQSGLAFAILKSKPV